MSRFLLSLIILTTLSDVKSQNWFQNDAVWHYTHFGAGVLSGYIKVEYKNDTILGGHIWRQFTNVANGVDLSASSAPYNFSYNPIFVRDTLGIQYCKFNGFSDTIYDFNKAIGDTIYLNTSGGCYKGVVTSTGTLVVNSFTLPYQVIDYSECIINTSFTLRDTVVKYIGSINYFLHPFLTFDIPLSSSPEEFGFFRCFQDSIINSYIHDGFWVANSCEWNLLMDEMNVQNSLFYYPNPTQGLITVKFEKPRNFTYIKIINSLGEIILEYNLIPGLEFEFNISDKPKGVYFMLISIDNNATIHRVILN